MEFYKEGKVFTVAANTTLDLSGVTYNHKAAHIVCDSSSCFTDYVEIKFWTKGQKSSAVSFIISDVGLLETAIITSFTNGIIPVRLAEITPSQTIRVTLFN